MRAATSGITPERVFGHELEHGLNEKKAALWAALNAVGLDWRTNVKPLMWEIAFALRRLAERGQAIERLVEVRCTARQTKQQRECRFAEVECVNPFVPRIVPPRPGVARRVKGRATADDEVAAEG